jgi:phage gp45-like
MSAKPEEELEQHSEEEAEETSDRREIYLREGRTLTVEKTGGDELVEIRSSSGMVELRIRLTEEGPVLQMESARLQLKASEAVEIESKRIEIRATESVQLVSENEVKVDAEGEVRVNGKTIWLN